MRGKGFEKPHSEGGKVLKNLTLKGGRVSKKSSRRGPYVLKTDTTRQSGMGPFEAKEHGKQSVRD
jgi:hypothetical protein